MFKKLIASASILAFFASPLSTFAYFDPTIGLNNLFTGESIAPPVWQTNGALTERVPIKVPPGRNNLTPDLTLTYNSQQLQDGPTGYGWSLSVPYVERLNKSGSERLYTDNYFTSSFGGELATTSVTNEYRHRIEDGSFLSFYFSDTRWTAYDKLGTRFLFGTSTAARQAATTSPSNVYRWMLQEVRDKNDNYIKYEYTSDGNQIYPSQITYTGNATTDGLFTVTFTYETRPDTITSYKSGFKVTTSKRLTEIQALVSGSLVRKYVLAYASGVNGARSLLSSVTETGRDESGNQLSLPAWSFAYSSSTPAYTVATNLQVSDNTDIVGDVDGNGLPDLSSFYQNSATLNTYRNVQSNFYPTFNGYDEQISTEYWGCESQAAERGVRFFDANGDGKADILRHDSNNGSPATTSLRGVGDLTWVGESVAAGTIPMFANTWGSGAYSSGLFGNINGDGLIDYVVSLNACEGGGCGENGAYLHLATTTGWEAMATSTAWNPIGYMPTSVGEDSISQLVDINGDGLDDWMRSDGDSSDFCLNTGTNWDSTCSSAWNIATSTRHANGWDRGIRYVDINGDDLPDYIRSYHMPSYSTKCGGTLDNQIGDYNYIYLNTGSGFAAATSSFQVPATISNSSLDSSQWCGTTEYDELVDWNGDGTPDDKDDISTNSKPDLLTTITYPTGGTSTLTYKYTAQLRYSSAVLSNPNLPFPVLVATKRVNDDGFGTTETISYDYFSGKTYISGNVLDRRFAGFEMMTERKGDILTKSYFYQGDTASTTVGEAADHYSKIGKMYRQDIIASSTEALHKRIFYNWDSVTLATSTGRYFVPLTKMMEQAYDGDSDHKDKAEAYTYESGYGNLLQKIEWGEVTGAADGTFVDTGSDKRVTDILYTASSTAATSSPATNTYSLDLEDGSTQYATVSDSASLSPTSAISVENWVKFESLPSSGNHMTFAWKWAGSNQRTWWWALTNDSGTYKLRWLPDQYGTGATQDAEPVSWTPSTGTWYHVAVTYAPGATSETKVHVDGLQQGATQTGTVTAVFDSTAPVDVGGNSGGIYLDGTIDDVRIWNTVRTVGEISGNKNAELTGSESGLVAYWKLNNAATDLTANANNLTLTNNPVYSSDVPFT